MQRMIKRSNNTTTILLLPWLAHGHISPYLELAKKLITFSTTTNTNQNLKPNIKIYICSTAANLSSINTKTLMRNPSHARAIEFVELRLPELPGLPPARHTTNALPPALMPSLKTAFDAASADFGRVLDALAPDLLVYGFVQPWAATMAAERGVPAVLFISCAASVALLLPGSRRGEQISFPEIQLRGMEREAAESAANGVRDVERFRLSCERSDGFVLFKTFAEIEGKYFEHLSSVLGKRIVPVGPLVDDDQDSDDVEDEVIKWLNKRPRSSVVFVSFGSEYFLSKEDIEEIAHGLELCKVSFIWVIRFPLGEKTSMEEALPNEFLKKIRDRGIVKEGWALQKEILRSESIGGFVSHCGFSSVMESMMFGVPIVAMPMHLDQPINSWLVEEIGIGLEVKREIGSGKLLREELAKTIKTVVMERGGEIVRRKAAEMKETMKRKGNDEIREVVRELMQLCKRGSLNLNESVT